MGKGKPLTCETESPGGHSSGRGRFGGYAASRVTACKASMTKEETIKSANDAVKEGKGR